MKMNYENRNNWHYNYHRYGQNIRKIHNNYYYSQPFQPQHNNDMNLSPHENNKQ
jgi:hypothetical protein